MKRTILMAATAFWPVLAAVAQEQSSAKHFLPGHLAVLRAGDGVFDLGPKQSPVFVDQFDPHGSNAGPSLTVAISTNGPSSFFFNGHAATEGLMTRAANRKLLTFAGYGGVNLLEMGGTASRLDIQRGFATVDNGANIHTYLYKTSVSGAKLNPRGAATDGTNGFWGSGNADGTLYFKATDHQEPTRFSAFPNSRSVRIINDILYTRMNAAVGYASDKPAGIYTFQPTPLPRQAGAAANLVIPAKYQKVVAFDINPSGNIAYMSDTEAGI